MFYVLRKTLEKTKKTSFCIHKLCNIAAMELHVPAQVREYFQEYSKIMTNKCFLRCPVWEQANHHFPNHKKHLERFKAWVEAIGKKLETDADYEYFRKKRLCHIHFASTYCYGDRRLSPMAVPTLHLTKESRADYWAKDLEIRKSKILQSMIHKDEISKDQAETSNNKSVKDVPEGTNIAQNLLRSDSLGKLVNVLISDVLNGEGENKNDIDSVQEQPVRELSVPSPVETSVLNPVAEIIIQYLPESEVSIQNLLRTDTSTDITSEVLEDLQSKPVPTYETPDSTSLETCAKEIEKKLKSKICIKPIKKNLKVNTMNCPGSHL